MPDVYVHRYDADRALVDARSYSWHTAPEGVPPNILEVLAERSVRRIGVDRNDGTTTIYRRGDNGA